VERGGQQVNTLAVVVSAGARTSIGLTARHTAFLLRAGVAGFHEAPLVDLDDEPVTFGSVPTIDPMLVGADRVGLLAAAALDEALEPFEEKLAGLRVHVILGLDEPLGRKMGATPAPADGLAADVHRRLTERGAQVTVETIARGEASAGLRLGAACEGLGRRDADVLLLGGAHSDYDPEVVQRLAELGRLFGAGNVHGVLPGESAAFVALSTPGFASKHDLPPRARLHGVGVGFEKAGPDNDESAFEALGLTFAVRTAASVLEAEKLKVGWLLTDMTPEVHRVHEWQAVLVRSNRYLCAPQWVEAHASKLGRLGAAALPLHAALIANAFRHGFAPHERALSMVGSDSGERVATVWGAPG